MVKHLHRLEDENMKKWVEAYFSLNNLIKSLFEKNCVTCIANLVSTSYIMFENNSSNTPKINFTSFKIHR